MLYYDDIWQISGPVIISMEDCIEVILQEQHSWFSRHCSHNVTLLIGSAFAGVYGLWAAFCMPGLRVPFRLKVLWLSTYFSLSNREKLRKLKRSGLIFSGAIFTFNKRTNCKCYQASRWTQRPSGWPGIRRRTFGKSRWLLNEDKMSARTRRTCNISWIKNAGFCSLVCGISVHRIWNKLHVADLFKE